MKLIVLDPHSTDPTFGDAKEAVIVEVSDDFGDIDGRIIKEYMDANPDSVKPLPLNQ